MRGSTSAARASTPPSAPCPAAICRRSSSRVSSPLIPPVLIIAQPTRGVDVGAIEFIHTRIIEKRNAGCAILLCSADLDEVFRLSDRIITMYEGRITGEFRTSDITKEEIGWYMTGHREGKEAAKA